MTFIRINIFIVYFFPFFTHFSKRPPYRLLYLLYLYWCDVVTCVQTYTRNKFKLTLNILTASYPVFLIVFQNLSPELSLGVVDSLYLQTSPLTAHNGFLVNIQRKAKKHQKFVNCLQLPVALKTMIILTKVVS